MTHNITLTENQAKMLLVLINELQMNGGLSETAKINVIDVSKKLRDIAYPKLNS